MGTKIPYQFLESDPNQVLSDLGREGVMKALSEMLLIRHFEVRGEAAYQQGKVGGFYHSYIGQEAIQTACLSACGKNHWFTTTYRCHALALLLSGSPEACMAELYGKKTGIAKGRGGSMHMYADRLLGGLAIVGGHVPIATGAAFSLQYRGVKGEASFCFLGDGAVVQGAFHESLNLASLWSLPCIYVIENNQWGMGTAVERAVAVQPIAEHYAQSYNIPSYTLDGMDFFNCYTGFQRAMKRLFEEKKPVLIEVVTQRFKGHSISDPGLYRSKEALQKCMESDPILKLKKCLIEKKLLTEEEFEQMDQTQKKTILQAIEFAETSPFPDPAELEEGVLAPMEGSDG